MHANLILLFKPALYSSTLVIKLRPVFFYKLRKLHGTPAYKTKTLRLVSNIQLVKRLSPCNEWQIQHYLALLWK